MAKTAKKRTARLGRGLSSLMAKPVTLEPPPPEKTSGVPRGTDTQSNLAYLAVESIDENPYQPRQDIGQSSLQPLADSIQANGLMQPIVVRPQSEPGRFELVAGERRWRAAQLAGIAKIPALVRDLADQQLAEWALIENLQREDLNPMERADAFSRLASEFGLSHEQIAKRLGLERSTVTNLLRLTTLTDSVQQLVREGLISMGQARALAGLSDADAQQKMAQLIVRQGWSVRQVEAAIRRMNYVHSSSPASDAGPKKAAHIQDLEKKISAHLGTRVSIKPGRKKGAGALTLQFNSLQQFDALMAQLGIELEDE